MSQFPNTGEVLVDRDGYTVTDADGFEVDQSCVTACCDGQPPNPCCPSVCGRRWMLCLREYSYSTTVTTVSLARVVNDAGEVISSSTATTEEFESLNLEGGPWAIPPVLDSRGECQLGVEQLVPMRHITSRRSSLSPVEDFRRERVFCMRAVTFCGGVPVSGGGRPVDVSTSLNGFIAALRFEELIPDETGSWNVGTETRPTNTAGVCSGFALPAGSNTRTTTRAFVWGPGPCTYDEENTTVIVEHVCLGGAGPEGLNFLARTTTTTVVSRKRIRLEWRITEDCDGTIHQACDGQIPTGCGGPLSFIEGRACARGNPLVPQRVYLPVGNVTACGTVRVSAAGDFCYVFELRGPIVAAVPPGGILGDEIVDKDSPKTCCACHPGCNRSAIARRPCWLSAFRDGAGQLVIEPAFVNDGGGCCCNATDIITIGYVESDLDLFGARQAWRLEPNAGLGLRFRRNEPFPLPPDQSDPRRGQFISAVFELLPDGGLGPRQFEQFWGPCVNLPPMACEWGPLMQAYFDFGRLHECVGTWNNSNGANASTLPCPSDGDVEINGWRLVRYSPAITCESIVLHGEWRHWSGGTLINRIQILIQRVAPPGDPCGGGCSGPQVQGGGGGGIGAVVVLEGGCGDCGGEDGRL